MRSTSTSIKNYNSNDNKKWDMMYNKHGLHIFHFIHRLLHNRQDAEDIMHETFVAALEKQDQLTGNPDSLKSYLFTIARYKSYDRLMQKRKAAAYAHEEAVEEEPQTESIEQIMIRQEVYAELHNAIKELPEESRKVLRMTWLEGMSIAQVAQLLDKERKTVGNQKREAVKQLRKLLPEWVLVTPFGMWLLHELEKM